MSNIPEAYFRNAIDLNRYSNSVSKELINSYNRIIIDAVTKLRVIDSMPQANQPAYKAARLKALLKQTTDSLSKWSGKSSQTIIKEMSGLAQVQTKFAIDQLKAALPVGSQNMVRSVEVSPSFAEAVVSKKTTDLNASILSDNLKAKVKGVPSSFSLTAKKGAQIVLPNGDVVSKAFRGLASKQADLFGRTIRDGLLTGQTTQELSRRLIGRLQFGEKAKTVHQIAQAGGELTKMANHQVMTLVRTTVQQVSGEAAQTVYEANQDITKQYEWIATLDGRTAPECRALDGQEFEYGKGPTPPQHFRCRCRTAAVLDYAGLGVKPPKIKYSKRAAEGGSVPMGTTYGQWIQKQGVAKRAAVFGGKQEVLPNGKKAWRGKFQYFDQLAKKYGPNEALVKMVKADGSEKTLSQLAKAYGKDPALSKKLQKTPKVAKAPVKPTPKVAKVPVKTKTKAVDELIKKEGKYMTPAQVKQYKSGQLDPKDFKPLSSTQKKLIDQSADDVVLKQAKLQLVNKENEIAAKAKALGIDPDVVKAKPKKVKASDQKVPEYGTKEYKKWKKDLNDEIAALKKSLGKAQNVSNKKTSDYDFDDPLDLNRDRRKELRELHGIRRAEEYTAEAKRNKAKLKTLKSEFKKKTTDKIYNTDYKYKGEDLVKDEWVDLGPARIKKMGYTIDNKRLDGTKVKGWSSEFEFVEDAVTGWKGGSTSYQAVQAYRLDKAGVELSSFGEHRASLGRSMFDPKNKTKAEIKRKAKQWERFSKKTDALEKFVERAPTYSGEIKRGIQLDPDDFHNFIQDLIDGKQSAVMESWSSDWGIANDFAGVQQIGKKFYMNDELWDPHRISARLTVRENKYGSSIQELGIGFQNEKEVLIPGKVRYRVVEIKTAPVLEEGLGFTDSGDELWEIILEQI